MKPIRLALLLLLGVSLWAQVPPSYPWYIADTYSCGQGVNGNEWSGGENATDWCPNGQNAGLLDSPVSSTMTPVQTPPGGWTDYELQVTFANVGYNVGTTLFARMSAAGYYQVSVALTGHAPQYGYLASVTLSKYLAQQGSTVLATTSYSPGAGAAVPIGLTVRQNKIILSVGNLAPFVVQDSSLTSGPPGIYLPIGATGIIGDAVGPIDTVPPSTPTNLQALPHPDGVNLSWGASSDGANGIGLASYLIYQDGDYLGSSTTTQFTGGTTAPGQQTTFTVYAENWHLTESPPATLTVTMPSANAMVPLRSGVRANGAYWGSAGEQVDLLSGGLNFSVPLIRALARDNWGATFALSYNSQLWAQNSQGAFNLGYDVGYGYGWKLQAGSILPVFRDAAVDHYIYTDASGAEYVLDQNNNNVWSSTQGVYARYDANAAILHFPDGSFWSMTDQSAAGEPDAGTLYPVTIEDSNGNQIVVQYFIGQGGTGYSSSSSRISTIVDSRPFSYYADYRFFYDTEQIPHLTSIVNGVGTPESYTFSYTSSGLGSPFGNGQSFGTARFLTASSTTGIGTSTSFSYWSGPAGWTGELTSMTTALGGVLSWAYQPFTYSGSGLTLREVGTRQATPVYGGASYSWTMTLDPTAAVQHSYAIVADNGTGTSKEWWFLNPSSSSPYNAPPYAGLPSSYAEIASAANGGATLLLKNYGWTQYQNGSTLGNVYESSVDTQLNPNTSYTAESKATQTEDAYGNVTQSKQYDYGSLSTPARTYNYTYLTGSNYAPLYIFNRMVSATLTTSSGNTTLVQNYYDNQGQLPAVSCNNLVNLTNGSAPDPSSLAAFDQNYANVFYAGNLTASHTLKSDRCIGYQVGGVAIGSVDGTVLETDVNVSNLTDYSLPDSLTTSNPGVSGSLTYTPSFAVTSVTAGNGTNVHTSYDQYGRPATATSQDGAVTTYSYAYYGGSTNPYYPNGNTQTAALGNTSTPRWKRTTLDGFGRTIRVESGTGSYSSGTVSIADTQYAPCACSPLGKMSAVSQPYAPGGTPVWTTYTYDGSGRTLTVTAPDGSVTSYSYAGNTTTVTDPAGNSKAFTSDSFGNLTLVTEPNPAGGSNLTTTYTYDGLNHLTVVSMPRSTGTQTRSFTYSGGDMLSATNPENGTVNYAYDSAHRLTTRTDALGQQTRYTYDSYSRPLWRTYYLPNGSGGWIQQTAQTVQYYWDCDALLLNGYCLDSSAGLLGGIAFGGGPGGTLVYNYIYTNQGRPAVRTLKMTTAPSNWGSNWGPLLTSDQYTWDTEGRPTSETARIANQWGYGCSGCGLAGFQFSYDSMGRPTSLQQYNYSNASWNTVANNASYTPAGQLSGLWTSFTNQAESFTYNNLLQLTRETVPGLLDMQYNFASGLNNGQVAGTADNISGETVSYTYDSLNRLIAASTGSSGPQWGEAYSYDGFGNLTGKTVTKGSGPSLSVSYNPATNQPSNGNYDANGNAPIGAWDIENHLVSQTLDGNAISWGYDPDGKRIMKYQVVNGQPQWIFYAYNYAGQRLGEVTCMTTSSFSCTVTATNTYFGGKLIAAVDNNGHVLAATDRLGTVRAVSTNGTWSTPSYFPWGEQKTAGGVDTKEQFATYVRDSTASAQDYAEARYYTNVTGRFYSPDPSMNNVNYSNPVTWNAYAYVNGDPINLSDPSGLKECGDFSMSLGGTVRDQVAAQTTQGHFIDFVWHEAGFLSQAGYNVSTWLAEFDAIAQAIWDRYEIVSGYVSVVGANGTVYAGPSASQLGYGSGSLNNVLIQAAADTGILNSMGGLNNSSPLTNDLNEDQGNIYQYQAGRVEMNDLYGNPIWITQDCASAVAALQAVNSVEVGINFNPPGMFMTSWNVRNPINNPNYAAGVEYLLGTIGPTNVFGFYQPISGSFGAVPPVRKPRRAQ